MCSEHRLPQHTTQLETAERLHSIISYPQPLSIHYKQLGDLMPCGTNSVTQVGDMTQPTSNIWMSLIVKLL